MKELEYCDPYQLVIVGLDTDDREDHALFDERVFLPVDENLVRNIMTNGVLQPVNVRLEDGKLFVVDGRQRVRASREAVKRLTGAGEHPVKVPARITRGDDSVMMSTMVSTNELRQSDDILTKAKKAVRMYNRVHDIGIVAVQFGRSPSTIKGWIALAEADESIHEALQSGRISPTAAVELCSFPRKEQAAKVQLLVNSNRPKDFQEELASLNRVAAPIAPAEAPVQAPPAEDPMAGMTTKQGKKKERPVSIADVKRLKKGELRVKAKSGIRHSWLKQALSTKAAESLKPAQRSVLDWFVSADASADDWFFDFAKAANSEINKRKKSKEK